MKKISKLFSSLYTRIDIKIREKKFNNQLNYLFYSQKSDTLLIIFSAFTGEKRRYNYVRGLAKCQADRLYILDPWGYKGSYNMYENGFDYPEKITDALISEIMKKGNYKRVITAGSSKGGTCAIYFGLKHGVNEIFSGACQYNLGSYLHRKDHESIFLGMMGENAGDKEAEILNKKIPHCLEKSQGTSTIIHVLYSKKELTYQRQIVDLLAKLKECRYKYIEIEEQFIRHDDVGYSFLNYLLNNIK